MGSGLSPPHSLLSARHVPCKPSLCGIRMEGSSCGTGRGREAGWGVGGGAEGPAGGSGTVGLLAIAPRDTQASLSLLTQALSPPCGCEVSLRPVRLQDPRGRAPQGCGAHSWGTQGSERRDKQPRVTQRTAGRDIPSCAPIPVLQARESKVGDRGRKFRVQEEAQRGQASCLWLHSGVKSSPSTLLLSCLGTLSSCPASYRWLREPRM